MFLVGILSWWYGSGFVRRIRIAKDRLKNIADFFSIRLLLKTLFAPYRQISADATGESLGDKMRAFFDRLLSRVIGSIVRTFMIILGLISITIQIVFDVAILVFWLIIPFMPAIGLIMMVIGWVPKWMS